MAEGNLFFPKILLNTSNQLDIILHVQTTKNIFYECALCYGFSHIIPSQCSLSKSLGKRRI